ncbi:MAG: glycosyltransferase family 4 protein [Actinobacteria bacterium]|nr:glycosyltransferase family 4 protein [Actinomycetota bacterium]
MSASLGKALILVENLSVPFDRRVWQEARSLTAAGYGVTVICPQGRGRDTEAHVVLDEIDVHRYPLHGADGGALSYAREYATALSRTASLIYRLGRSTAFDVVHACNPPDALILTALPLRRRGAAVVFDHHDLVPELYVSRFERRGPLHRATLIAERLAFLLADVVVSTNESYRRVAIERGRKSPEDVFVVRSAPDPERFRPIPADDSLRRGQRYLIAYLGVMGPQDGVDHALRALAILRRTRSDWHAIFVGEGDVFDQMKALAVQLGLGGSVEFTGRVPDEEVIRIMSTAEVCLAPDPKNPLNDVSTMNKIVEYMALGRPIVSYDLTEARVSAGSAALYATPNDVEDFARCIGDLLDSPTRREELGRGGRRRFEDEISWRRSEEQLLAAYGRALELARRRR